MSSKLKYWENRDLIVADEYKKFFEELNQKTCSSCKKQLNVVEYKKNGNEVVSRFECGHRLVESALFETIKIQDSLKGTHKRKGFGLLKKLFHGYKPSGDPRLTKGVTYHMEVDRERNEYHQKVIDNITGEVIHEEHEPLTGHHSK